MDHDIVEATRAAKDAWSANSREIADATLFGQGNRWIFGANMPGSPHTVLFDIAGAGSYRDVLCEVVAEDYRGFEITAVASAVEHAGVVGR